MVLPPVRVGNRLELIEAEFASHDIAVK